MHIVLHNRSSMYLRSFHYYQVCITIYWLGRKLAYTPGYKGPQLNLEAFKEILDIPSVWSLYSYYYSNAVCSCVNLLCFLVTFVLYHSYTVVILSLHVHIQCLLLIIFTELFAHVCLNAWVKECDLSHDWVAYSRLTNTLATTTL